MTMYEDYQSYFDSAKPGETRDFAEGTLSMGNNGMANYTDPTGKTTMFGADSNLEDVYNSNPFIARGFDSKYGDVTSMWQEPFDLTGLSGPTSMSRSNGSNHSQSKTGINWNTDLASSLLPNLISSGQNAQSAVDNLGTTLNDQYANTMRQAMQPQNFQGVLNDLATRGMLNSSVAGQAMGNAGQGVAQGIANNQFDSNIAQANAQMQLPSTLANLAALANETNSSGGGSSSSYSYSQNDLAPYELMATMMKY